MFGEFHGLPIHALVLHVAVVLTPLAAVVGLVFLVPRWRRLLRWPLVAVAALTVIVLFVTKQSGQNLKAALGDQLNNDVTGSLVQRHQQLGDRLFIVMIVFFAATVAGALLVPAGGAAVRPMNSAGWLSHAVAAVVAFGAAFVLVLVYQVGEAGAKATWNPSGTFDYSSK